MKKNWIFFLLVSLFVISACDNDIDLTAEFKDIPIVYGLISSNDDVHYVKIQRAFLGSQDDNNALEIAQNPDSLYYTNLDVKLQRAGTDDIYSLSPVSAVDEGFEREEGIFAQEPNTVYKLILPDGEELVEGAEYILRINRGDDQPEVTASTILVEEFSVTNPSSAGDISIRYRQFTMGWRKKAGAAFYDVKIFIHYLEQNPENPSEFLEKTLIWDLAQNLDADTGSPNVFSFQFDGEEFYRFIGAELDDNQGFSRILSSFDFVIDAGGQELFDFINIGSANTGITASQVIPTYTNLSEGFGVFSSRYRLIHAGFTLNSEGRDSLANGIYTSDLGFN